MTPMTNHTATPLPVWTTSESADAQAHDQEIDLGDGWHALVFPFGNGVNWGWELWDQWMHSDEDGEYYPCNNGVESSEVGAKAAALAAAHHYGRFPVGQPEPTTPIPEPTDTVTIDRDILAQAHDALIDATCIVPANHPDYRAIMDALKAVRGVMYR